MRGLYKVTGYWNTVEALKDWARIEEQAISIGLGDEATNLRPATDAGWRTIDKQIAKLRAIIQQADEYCKCNNPVHLIKQRDTWICDRCNLPQE